PGLDAHDGPLAEVLGVGHEQRTDAGEPLLGEVGFLHDVVLEIAAGQQHGGAGGGQVGVLALEPGAGTAPRVGEAVDLAARYGPGRGGVAAPPAPHPPDVVPPGTDHAGQSSERARGLSSLVCPRRPRYSRAVTTAADPS